MNKKVIGLMKYKLGGNIITEFVALWPKACSYLTDDDKNVKKTKVTEKRVIKRILNSKKKKKELQKLLIEEGSYIKTTAKVWKWRTLCIYWRNQ